MSGKKIIEGLKQAAGITKTFRHNGRLWFIVRIGQNYFARDDQGSDTGPYSQPECAEEWVRGIRP